MTPLSTDKSQRRQKTRKHPEKQHGRHEAAGGRGGRLPMVAMMLVLRAARGSESMSSRHRCSRKVSAIAADSCCRWKKAVPSSWLSCATLARRRYPAGPAGEGATWAPASAPCLSPHKPCTPSLGFLVLVS